MNKKQDAKSEKQKARNEIVLQYIPIKDLIPTPDNPRAIETIDKDFPRFVELLNSVRAVGVQEPVLARPRPAHWCAMIRHGYVRILNVRPELLAELGMLPGGVGWRLYAGYWN